MKTMVLSLGSNCGDRHIAVRSAIKWLEGVLDDCRFSSLYETPAYGNHGGPYVNAVVAGHFDGDTDVLNTMCKRYECLHGRDEAARTASLVPIDIDIVVADGDILRPNDFARGFFQIGYRQLSLCLHDGSGLY